MKISYVLALALASNLMLNAEEAVNLSPVTVSSKMQKSSKGGKMDRVLKGHRYGA